MRLHYPLSSPHRRCHALVPGQQCSAAAPRLQARQHTYRRHSVLQAATENADSVPAAASPASTNGSSSGSTAQIDRSAAAVQPPASPEAVMQMQLQMQLQMQQQMAQMTAMLQAAQQQNALLWEQMQQMQQQLQAVQSPAIATAADEAGSTLDSAAAAAAQAAVPTAAADADAVHQTAAETHAPASDAAADVTSEATNTEQVPAAAAAVAAEEQPVAAAAAAIPTATSLPEASHAGSTSAAATTAAAAAEPSVTPAAAASPAIAATRQARDQLKAATAAAKAAKAAAASDLSREAAAAREVSQKLAAATAAAKASSSSTAAAAAAAAGKVDKASKKEKADGSSNKRQQQQQSKAEVANQAPSSSSVVNVKQQLEQAQKLNQAMAQLLQARQQRTATAAAVAAPPEAAAAAVTPLDAVAAAAPKAAADQVEGDNSKADVASEQNSTAALPADTTGTPQQQQQQTVAAVATAALAELKELQAKQQAAAANTAAAAAAAKPPSRRTAAAAATADSTSNTAAATPAAAAAARRRPDALLQRISSSRSARELQVLFERQQQRLRPHHLAALVARLPETHEGRTAAADLAAAAATFADSSSSNVGKGATAAVTAFADDLVTMLQLQLGMLTAEQLLGVIEAAAALQLSPRPAWLSSFQAASQSKLGTLSPTQLASIAAAMAAVTAAAAGGPTSAATATKQQQQSVRVAPAWLKAWTAAAKQQLQQLTSDLQQQQQQTDAAAASTDPAAASNKSGAAVANIAPVADEGAGTGSTAIGQLAVAAVQLGAFKAPGQRQATDTGSSSSSSLSGPGPAAPDRLEFTAALVTAAAAASSKVSLSATAAADMAYGLTELIVQQPGLASELQQQQQQADVAAVLAAVAAAAQGSMSGSSSSTLMRLVRGVIAAGAQPDPEWRSEMAAALSRQLRQLTAADSLTVVEAFSSWYNHPQQQQQQQQLEETLDLQLQRLLGGLLTQTAAASTTFTPQQLTRIITTLGIQMGFRVSDHEHESAVRGLLAELSHAHNVTLLSNKQLVQLLQALAGLGVPPGEGFTAAVQREGVKPRLATLKPQELADLAQALAGLRVQMEYDVMDGYWTELEGNLKQLTDSDRVALLCCLGTLRQKPRAQLLGAFLVDMMPRLKALNRPQLCACLNALSQLQLSKVDTQGVRVTTAQAVPAPAEFISELLKHLNPQLSGPEGATAAELASVLQALAALGFKPDQMWLAEALTGAADKIRSAVVAPGGEQTLVSMLHALSQISVKAPSEVLTEALTQLQGISDRLSAVQISAAMSALKTLDLDPDDQLMGSYLDRAAAAAAAGSATAKDMAAVLQSLAAADVVPAADWLNSYLAAAKQQMKDADSATLATIAQAAAALIDAGQAGSSSSSYIPDPAFVSELVAVAKSRLGSSYMDAARILNTPDFKVPFTLRELADCSWGLHKLGAQPKDLQSMINMLISKSYDRFSQLSVQQLSGAAWAIAKCSSSSKGAAAVKLPSKWLNQFATAAAPEVQQLTQPQLSELVWALGRLYLGADSQYSSGSSSDGSSSSSVGRSSEVPVQQLLRALASQFDAALVEPAAAAAPAASFPTAADVSILVNLLTKFDCSASRRLLQRFCADVAAEWAVLSDSTVTDAAVAVAELVGPGSSDIIPAGWLDALAVQVHDRLQQLHPQLRCRCLWALATLKHSPGRSWLTEYAAAAFTPKQIAALQPGDLSDALWGLYTLEQLDLQQQSAVRPSLAAAGTGPDSLAAAGTGPDSLITPSLLQLLAKKLDKRVNELQAGQVLRLLLLAEGALTVAPSYSLPKGVADGLSQMLSARAAVVAETTGVIGLVWAAARLGLRLHIGTLDQFCKKIYAQLPGLSAGDMARGFWASKKLGYSWLPPQLEEFDRQSSSKLSDMSGADVALLLEAFKGFGHAPSQAWLSKFAEMPATSLMQLSCTEAVQLAVQLADVLPADKIVWLPAWSENLTGQQLQNMTGQQVFSIIRLRSGASSTPGGTALYGPSDQLLSMLCWAVLPHISTASAEDVYRLVCDLASWQFVPPNGDVLVSATAARLAEKFPVLSQLQAVEVLCAFAALGFTIGEPLQSKLCSKVMQAAATGSSSMNAAATAEVLAAALVTFRNPEPDVVNTLMQQLIGKFECVPSRALLRLSQAMAAVRMQWQQPGAAAAAAAVIPTEFGQQYISAAVRAAKMGSYSLLDLAALCTALQATGLYRKNDVTLADGMTQALQPHIAAAVSSSSSSSDRSAAAVHVAAVATYITSCGYKPAACEREIDELLIQVLRDTSSSSSSAEYNTESTADGQIVIAAQQQQQQQFDAAAFAKLLLAMNAWGRRLSGSYAAAAFDWSRYKLATANITTLGPLLLGVCTVCGRPPAVWVLDWSAVVLQNLAQAGPEDLTAIAASLAEVGSTSDLCSTSWLQQYSQAVQSQLADLSEQQLEVIAASLYRLGFRPAKDWRDDVITELQRRAPATDTPAARAMAWIQQLKTV